jgi:hypothetical protein
MRFRLALTVLCFLLCNGPRGVGAEKSRFERLDAKVEDVGNESTKVELKGKMWDFPISRRRDCALGQIRGDFQSASSHRFGVWRDHASRGL